jgi:ubiquinone biosynthesis protein UbiJ
MSKITKDCFLRDNTDMSHSSAKGQESISCQAFLDEIQALKDENQRLRARLEEA